MLVTKAQPVLFARGIVSPDTLAALRVSDLFAYHDLMQECDVPISEVGRSEAREEAQEPEHKTAVESCCLRRRRRSSRSQDNRGGGCDEEERSVCEREDVSEVGGSEQAEEPEHKPRWNVGLRRRSGSFGRGRSSCRGSERDEGDTNERFVASRV